MPLTGIRVVDLTRILAGPYATMTLADMGADVLKIERPGTGDDTRAWGPPFHDGMSTYFLAVNRNKRSMTLNLKEESAIAILWQLLGQADVVVSNFRSGVMDQLGLGYESVASRCPRIVYGVINGYGDSGESASRPSFDVIAQAESGLMEMTGAADGPPTKVGISLADEVAGLVLVQGVLLALLARQRTRRGQKVEVALRDALMSLFTYQAQAYLSAGQAPRRMGNEHPSIVPYQTFEAADGVLVVGVGNEAAWGRFCEVLSARDLLDDNRFATNSDRVQHRGILTEKLTERFACAPVAEWLQALEGASIPCGRVTSAAEAFDDPLTFEREMRVSIPGTDVEVTGIPVKMSATPGVVRTAPPALGSDTNEVLTELGHTAAQIDAWRVAGVI